MRARTLALLAVILAAHGREGLAAMPAWVPDQLIVQPRSQARSAAHRALAVEGTFTSDAIAPLGVVLVRTPPGRLQTVQRNLRASGLFGFVERNYTARITVVPNDPLYPSQWGLPAVDAPQAWDITRGAGVTIAVVDTGVDVSHPDLSDRIMRTFNAITGSSDVTDDNGHGTNIAGITAATGFDGVGVIGVAPEAHLMAVKALDSSGYGTYADIARGIVYASDQGARVINLSLGGGIDSAILSNAVGYAVAHGVVVVAAAGNDGASVREYPAAYADVIAVGATDQADAHAGFSNSGAWIDLVAPGVDVMTTDIGGGYAGVSGTSPAAPFVSGAAAMVLAANPLLQPRQVASLLALTSDDRGAPGFDPLYGWGRLNVARAVVEALALARTADANPPTVNITAPQNGVTIEGSVDLTAEASDDVGVTRVEYMVDGITVASATDVPYAATWDSTLATAGPHVLTATAYDASGNRGSGPPVALTVSGNQVTCATAGAVCIAGGGKANTDCFMEWLIAGESVVQESRRGGSISCQDGAACDGDGQADGVCTFDVGLCFAVSDPRLVDSRGQAACDAADIGLFQLLSPAVRRNSSALDAANATSLVAAVAALTGARSTGTCVAGWRRAACHDDSDCDSRAGVQDGMCAAQQAALSGSIGGVERCTAIQRLRVPVRQLAWGSIPGTRTFRTTTSAVPLQPGKRPSKDIDAVQFVCLPATGL